MTDYFAIRFGGDFLAGITVASMLIPQSVSYGSALAKLSPVTGLVSQQPSSLPCALPMIKHNSRLLKPVTSVFGIDSPNHLRFSRLFKTT